MTEVAFHFGAPDKLAYAGRLLRKATGAGARLWVLASQAQRQSLTPLLWGLTPTSFVTHCQQEADISVQKRSAVMLVSDLTQDPQGYRVLVNLCADMPQGFERFERVIEVVSHEEEDRQAARQRWRHYTALGYTIVRHDLNLRPGS